MTSGNTKRDGRNESAPRGGVVRALVKSDALHPSRLGRDHHKRDLRWRHPQPRLSIRNHQRCIPNRFGIPAAAYCTVLSTSSEETGKEIIPSERAGRRAGRRNEHVDPPSSCSEHQHTITIVKHSSLRPAPSTLGGGRNRRGRWRDERLQARHCRHPCILYPCELRIPVD